MWETLGMWILWHLLPSEQKQHLLGRSHHTEKWTALWQPERSQTPFASALLILPGVQPLHLFCSPLWADLVLTTPLQCPSRLRVVSALAPKLRAGPAIRQSLLFARSCFHFCFASVDLLSWQFYQTMKQQVVWLQFKSIWGTTTAALTDLARN